MKKEEHPLNKLDHPAFEIFPRMLAERADDLYYGDLPKGKFIGMYMGQINQFADLEEHEIIHLKYPQFVSNDSDNRNNNWLDFVINLDEVTFKEFKRGLKL